jgi:CHU_C Type IX secretion signal domain
MWRLVFLFFVIPAYGQNLVPNPSFELYKPCELLDLFGGDTSIYDGNIDMWAAADNSFWFDHIIISDQDITDFCNYFIYNNLISEFGPQEPHSGTSFVGLRFIVYFSTSEGEFRGYLQTYLNNPLQGNQRYCGGFYTSLCDTTYEATFGVYPIVSDWGMLLSKERPLISEEFILDSDPPVDWKILTGDPQVLINAPIIDTVNWVLVSDTFTAIGSERWLSIGMFSPFGLTNHTLNGPLDTSWLETGAMYFLDDVFVLPLDDGALLPSDTIICSSGFPMQLAAYTDFTDYQWSDGVQAPTKQIDGPGTYQLQARRGNCLFTDSIVILGNQLDITLTDTVLCGEELPVQFSLPPTPGYDDSFLWSTGGVSATVSIPQAGNYTVTATGFCGTTTAAFDISLEQDLQIGLDNTISLCADGVNTQPVQVSATNSLPNYLWSDGSQAATFLIQTPGWYSLTTYNSCGFFTDSIQALACPPLVYVPNVFKPSSINGANSRLMPFMSNAIWRSITVFDRWGNQIWLSDADPVLGWDGMFRGEPVPLGTYSYIITFEPLDGTGLQQVAGEVSLIE